MKRVGNLWAELSGFGNLLAAYEAAAAGKRKRPDVARFEMNLEGELACLHRELRSGEYRPGPYRTFTILDPKPRMISAAPFRDRVVHHALTRVLEPVFERRFCHYSFACRKGKGTHKALQVARRGARRFAYVLKVDISKYFASIDHAILNEQLARVVKCRPTLELAAKIIEGSNRQEEVIRYFPGDTLFTPYERRRGLPLGNQTSQFFANVYLNGLDHLVESELRPGAWARYVDDLVLFHDDRFRLREMFAAIESYLADLRLVVHPGKSRVHQCGEGFSFLGWRLFRDGRTRISRANAVRAGRRLLALRDGLLSGTVSWDLVQQSVRAWIAHATSFGPLSGTYTLRSRMLERFAFVRGAGPLGAGGVVHQQ